MTSLPSEDDRETLTRLTTTVWGPFGTNGLAGDMKRHREQIGQLYGRDESLRKDVEARLGAMDDRLSGKLDGIYKLMATLIVSILVGAVGIIATILVTLK